MDPLNGWFLVSGYTVKPGANALRLIRKLSCNDALVCLWDNLLPGLVTLIQAAKNAARCVNPRWLKNSPDEIASQPVDISDGELP